MKRIIRTTACVALLTMTTVSCQKDGMYQQNTNESLCGTTLYYAVDGVSHETSFYDNNGWDMIMNNLFALARQGYTIVIHTNTNNIPIKDKETITFTTTSESEAKEWANEMVTLGYTVTITFKSGVYTCIAEK
jgi:hypothetical protein